MRPSRRGRLRALSLVLVHLVAAAHILHWYVTGRTLTPVEPSEAMQTLGEGLVNAGFVLFALLILGTLAFGRFFCGWACHIVALQDLCTWLLGRVGIKPRPFRSRLLVYVPLGAAIYMFVLPALVRFGAGESFPALRAHFVTDDFWSRFPGWSVALLTFAVCGFLVVYMLGNKGFCTYGCPYGGVFGVADRFAPGRIRVTDDCEGCGHCTATCTSNVRVHEEVRDHGMVVDPGCMKCTDCVSVCPKGALYYGFGRLPSVRSKPQRKSKRFDFSWPEEGALAAIFAGSLLVLRALYDAVPLLLALGLAAISAYFVLTAVRTLHSRNLRAANLRLRNDGRTTPSGIVWVALAVVWVAFLGHSGVVRYLTYAGTREYQAARAALAEATGDPASTDAFRRSRDLLVRAERLGLVPVPNLLARLGSIHSHLGEHGRAETYYRRSVEAAPSFAASHFELARYALARNETESALRELRETVRTRPELPGAHDTLANLLLRLDRGDEATELLEGLLARRPHDPGFRLTYGLVLSQIGRDEDGLTQIERVIDEHPRRADAFFDLAQVLAKGGRFDEALEACSTSATIEPRDVETRFLCAKVAGKLERWGVAVEHLEVARRAAPFERRVVHAWAGAHLRAGSLSREVGRAESAPAADRETRYGLAFLYAASLRQDRAQEVLNEFTDEP